MRKNKLILAALALTLVATGAFVGCNKEESQSNLPNTEYEVSLDSEQFSMIIGEEKPLIASYAGQESATLTYTSSDESVVKVDENGKLTAIKAGTATITVTYGTASDTCVVTVGTDGILPALQLPNVNSTEIFMYKSAVMDLSGNVLFNGKTYDDVTLTYTLSNENVGKVENGVFKPLATGTTEITVSGTWRGISGESMVKKITVEVMPEFLFAINDGVSEITVYTETQTEAPFVVTVEYDSVPLQTSVEVTAGSEYIRYDAVNQTVASLGVAGEAEITVSYTLNDEEVEKKIPIHVKQTVYDYETTVTNFSAIHGDVATGTSLKEILGADILSAYDAEGKPLEVKDNKVYGVQSSNDGKFTTEITIYSNVRGYKLNIEGYSGVFAKAEDFAVFNMNATYGYEPLEDGTTATSKSFYAIDKTKPVQKWEGYYVLANNIDASKYMHARVGKDLATRGIQSGGYEDVGFHGTFDGQGYTVKGISVRSNGIFGYLINATVKNVAFADVTLVDKENATTLAAWIIDSTLTNVYVSIKNTSKLLEAGAAFACGINTSSLQNCIVETAGTFGYAPTDKTNATTGETTAVMPTFTGSFIYLSKELSDNDEKRSSFTDVFVISNEGLGYNKSNKYYLQAENETITVEGFTTYTLAGVKRYDNRTAMAEAGNNYSSFSADYWTVENGALVWKSLNGYYPPITEDSGNQGGDDDSGTTTPEKPSENIAVGDFKVEWL